MNKVFRACMFIAGICLSGYWGYVGSCTCLEHGSEMLLLIINILLTVCSLMAAVSFIMKSSRIMLLLSTLGILSAEILYVISSGQNIFAIASINAVCHVFSALYIVRVLLLSETGKKSLSIAAVLSFCPCAISAVSVLLSGTQSAVQTWLAVAVLTLLTLALSIAAEGCRSTNKRVLDGKSLIPVGRFRRYDFSCKLFGLGMVAVLLTLAFVGPLPYKWIVGERDIQNGFELFLFVLSGLSTPFMIMSLGVFYYTPLLIRHLRTFELCSDGSNMYILEKNIRPIQISSAKSIYVTFAKEMWYDRARQRHFRPVNTLRWVNGKIRKTQGIWITLFSADSVEYHTVFVQSSHFFPYDGEHYIYGLQYDKQIMKVISEHFEGNLFIEQDVYEVIRKDISDMTFRSKCMTVFNRSDNKM